MKYRPRHLERNLYARLEQFPVVVVTGSRQSGKSTMLQHMFTKTGWRYVTLDLRSTVEKIKADPDLFVKDIDSNIIIDEAQKAPELFHSLKYLVDKKKTYRIILSGSANFLLLAKVTESLAGRAAILELFPFSSGEIYRKASSSVIDMIYNINQAQDISRAKKVSQLSDTQIWGQVLYGGYPKLLEYKSHEQKQNWLDNYITTYLERDLRNLAQVGDIGDFQRFYKMLAFQSGNLLNLSNIASDIGISVPTCKKYLSILEASYQYILLRPYYINIRKRLIKSPKVYILDTGLGNYFIGNDSLDKLKNSGNLGHILETWVIIEFIKHNNIQHRKKNLYFWRTSNGAEVDLLIEDGKKIIPIEIKTTYRIKPESIRGLKEFISLDIGRDIPFGVVFYRGDEVYRISDKIWAIPISMI